MCQQAGQSFIQMKACRLFRWEGKKDILFAGNGIIWKSLVAIIQINQITTRVTFELRNVRKENNGVVREEK